MQQKQVFNPNSQSVQEAKQAWNKSKAAKTRATVSLPATDDYDTQHTNTLDAFAVTAIIYLLFIYDYDFYFLS
jgi:hypothetical protein